MNEPRFRTLTLNELNPEQRVVAAAELKDKQFS